MSLGFKCLDFEKFKGIEKTDLNCMIKPHSLLLVNTSYFN